METTSLYSINERFEFVTQMVTMMATSDQPSVIITGDSGIGKSHTVIKTLLSCGYIDITEFDDIDIADHISDKVFKKVSGYSTPKGLYQDLYENRNSNCILVFDDTDNILQNDVSINLLKAALDSYSKRIISWKSTIKTDLPKSFKFEGKVVFISNLSVTKINPALLTRSMTVDLSATRYDKIERMRYLINQNNFMEESFDIHKKDALDLIESLGSTVKDLSLRTLIQVTKIRYRSGIIDTDWKRLAQYIICS